MLPPPVFWLMGHPTRRAFPPSRAVANSGFRRHLQRLVRDGFAPSSPPAQYLRGHREELSVVTSCKVHWLNSTLLYASGKRGVNIAAIMVEGQIEKSQQVDRGGLWMF